MSTSAASVALWRARNPERAAEQTRSAQVSLRQRKRDFIDAFKAESGCRDCDERDVVVLDLHHLEEKDARLNRRLLGRSSSILGFSWDDLKIELSKCIVLCANCHRRQHHNERRK